MHDAVRPDEFRQRFAAASTVHHPHLAATYEVLEIGGRPAVLQEWLSGLASNEWPALATVPGVWFRLVLQAALGLQTAHQAGLVHGNLHAGQIVFTPEGVLKLCGFGEPAWLALEPPPGDVEPDTAGDLAALGRCALAWAMPSTDRKGAKPKPLPSSLQTVLWRLTGERGTEPYPSAGTLLEELDAAGADVPANPAAWERFVRQVREQSTDSPLRRSA
jgi:serine/threonine protein kinase